MTELKPCPFCGKKVSVILYWEGRINGYQYQVVCDVYENGCGASGRYCDTVEEAKEVWNRRAENDN